MTSLGEKWGCEPQTLLSFIEAKWTDEDNYRSRAPAAVRRSEAMLLAIEQNSLFLDAPSAFFFCRPKPISESEVDRTIPPALVPTETICQILGEALQVHDNNVRLTFFRALSQHNETRPQAGKPVKCQCQWMCDRKHTSVIQLTGSLSHSWSALTTRRPPCFWVAPGDIIGIDSALVREDDVYVFQLTISSEHGSPIGGMKKIRGYLPNRLRDIPWKVVFIGQERTAAMSVANKWADKIFFPTNKALVSIAWYEADPVVKGVH